MNFKKFNGSTWDAIRYKTYDTITEALDRTENLFNGTLEQGSFSVATDGGEYYTTTRVRTTGTVVSEAGTYTISAAGIDQVVIYVYDLNGNFKLAESDVSWGPCPETMSFNADRIVRFVFRYPDDSNITPSDVWNIMFCKSGETLPYEPYGFRLQASGEPLTNYTIYGNTSGVGERTKNLFDKNNADAVHLRPGKNANAVVATGTDGWSIILPVKPSTTYTISKLRMYAYNHWVGGTANYPVVGETLTFIDDHPETVAGDWAQNIFTTSADTHWVICWIVFSGTEQDLINVCDKLMVEESNGRTSYEPYGYKIPVTSGGVTTNLYTDSPLGLTDTLTYTDTGIALPTSDGDNTITFGTSVQPSAMSATFKGWHIVQSVKIYDTLSETLERTENLYDPSDAPVAMYPNQSTGAVEASTSSVIACSVIVQVEPNTEYTASFDTPSSGVRRRIGMYRQLPSVGLSAEAVDNTASEISGRSYNTFTTTANTTYILFMFYSKSASSGGSADEAKRIAKTITVRKGTSHVFVPYGFRLQASGEPLTDYTIYGNTGGVGERTKNLFDKNNADITRLYPVVASQSLTTGNTTYSVILPCEPNTTYTVSRKILSDTRQNRVGGTSAYPENGMQCTFIDDQAETVGNEWTWNIFTTDANTHYIVCWILMQATEQQLTEALKTLMIEKSDDRTSYEPYGYKIPVTSGGVTTNLYLDAPLDTGDTLTYTDTGIALPTFDGDDTITFDTTVQPSQMDAAFKGWHRDSIN